VFSQANSNIFYNRDQQTLKTTQGQLDWHLVGSDLKLPDKISEGPYWFFSQATLEKYRAAYWDHKYLKYSNGKSNFVLIKSNKNYFLQAHHKFYVLNRLPWEYPNTDFETLCNWCHWDFHNRERVKSYREVDGSLEPVTMTACYRCHGAGWFPQHDHIQNGICFRCLGVKFEDLIPKDSARRTNF